VRFWGWPPWSVLRFYAGLWAAGWVWFGFVYGGTDYVTAHRSLRIPVHFQAELAIPFVPGLVWIYLSINLIFLAVPFVLRSRAELLALWTALAIVVLVAGCSFLLIPSELAFPPPGDLGASGAVFRLADRINLHYNLLPSLHVALMVCCVAALAPRARRPGQVLLWGWALALSASTLFTHQHHVLDVLTGFPLGLAGARLIYDRLNPARTV
jgi:hypothetical protein